jgi:pseudolysin
MKTVGMVVGVCGLMASAQAAVLETLWSTDTKALQGYSIDNATGKQAPGARLYAGKAQGLSHTLRLYQGIVDSQGISHVRYNQYYQGIEVFGMQVMYHANSPLQLSGKVLQGIADDVKSLQPKVSPEAARGYAKLYYSQQVPSATHIRAERSRLVIYPVQQGDKTVAKLSYVVRFIASTAQGVTQPVLIIDATTQQVLAQWDAVMHAEIGQGPGGNEKKISLRPNQFQYGMGLTGPSLGKLDVSLQGDSCTLKNDFVQVSSLSQVRVPSVDDIFPIDIHKDADYPAFSYACSATNGYINANDGGYAPVNGSFSPLNDSLYFATQTYKMLQQQYHIAKPFGDDVPVRIYAQFFAYPPTGQPAFNNAFAMETLYNDDGSMSSHQQALIGNGGSVFYPMSQDTIPHELCHLMTANYSNLIYEKQSGGMNEAFSDICGVALLAYVQAQYPWFNYDWSVSIGETKESSFFKGGPMRCIDNPPCDGKSIDNVAQYSDGLDVHYSSGIYNKAFYLLSTSPGWTIPKAFSVLADANMFYWTPNETFNGGCLGVAQAAKNHGYNAMDVVKAFRGVGVSCKL